MLGRRKTNKLWLDHKKENSKLRSIILMSNNHKYSQNSNSRCNLFLSYTYSSLDENNLKHTRGRMGSKRQTAATVGERGPIQTPSGDTEHLLGQDVSTPGFVYVLAFFSALGGFLFGYDTGVVSGAMLLLKKEMNLNALWQELLVSSTVGAAALSALCGGSLNGWLGRRICILVASFIFGVGGIILSIAQGKVVLLVGRIVVGLGIGK